MGWLSNGLDDGWGVVGLDQGSILDNSLLDSVSKDWGHNIGFAVHNGGALVGHGSWDAVDMLSYFGDDWLFNDGNSGVNFDQSLARDHLFLECGQGDGCSEAWFQMSIVGQGGNETAWGSNSDG